MHCERRVLVPLDEGRRECPTRSPTCPRRWSPGVGGVAASRPWTATPASTFTLTVLGHTLTLVRSAPVQADRGQDAGLGPAKPGKGKVHDLWQKLNDSLSVVKKDEVT